MMHHQTNKIRSAIGVDYFTPVGPLNFSLTEVYQKGYRQNRRFRFNLVQHFNEKLKKFIIFLIFFIFNFICYESVDINLDFLFKNTNIGKEIIKKINSLDEQNIKQIKLEEKKLKQKETKLLNEKNLLSKEIFNKNLNELKNEIKNFKKEKIKNKKKIQKIKNE